MKALTHYNLDHDNLPPHAIRKSHELLDSLHLLSVTHRHNHQIATGSPLALETGYDQDATIFFNVEGCRVIFFYHFDPSLKGFPAYKNGIWGKVLTVNSSKFYFYIPYLRVQYALRLFSHDSTYPQMALSPLLMPPFIPQPEVPTYMSKLGNNLPDMDDIVFKMQFELLLLQNE